MIEREKSPARRGIKLASLGHDAATLPLAPPPLPYLVELKNAFVLGVFEPFAEFRFLVIVRLFRILLLRSLTGRLRIGLLLVDLESAEDDVFNKSKLGIIRTVVWPRMFATALGSNDSFCPT